MRRVIIDTDPGHDDALAILVAGAKSELDIRAISTVSGNQTLEKINRNALNLVAHLNLKVPVVQGADEPIFKERTIGDGLEIHGESGMDGYDFEPHNLNLVSENSVEHMFKEIMSSTEKTTLIPIGPLTNIAKLLRKHPEVQKKIDCISLMGGSIAGGNVTDFAEFNIYADPDAAQLVFDSGLEIIMCGLDVTEKAYITKYEIEKYFSGDGKCSAMVRGLLDFYSGYFERMGAEHILLHDVCSVLYLTNPEMFSGERGRIEVDYSNGPYRGQTRLCKASEAENKNNVLILKEVDRDSLLKEIYLSVKKMDQALAI